MHLLAHPLRGTGISHIWTLPFWQCRRSNFCTRGAPLAPMIGGANSASFSSLAGAVDAKTVPFRGDTCPWGGSSEGAGSAAYNGQTNSSMGMLTARTKISSGRPSFQ